MDDLQSTGIDEDGQPCPICLHAYRPDRMNKHHLVPKSRKGKITIVICRNCHRQIHAVYSEKELERNFGTLEALLAAEQLQSWIAWVRKRKPGSRVTTRMSKRKRR
jgi:hypothetical protein